MELGEVLVVCTPLVLLCCHWLVYLCTPAHGCLVERTSLEALELLPRSVVY